MLRKLMIPVLLMCGLGACRAHVKAGSVHAGAGVGTR